MLLFIGSESKRLKIEWDTIVGTVAWATIGTFVGGRITYLLVNFDYFLSDMSMALRFWQGGLVSFGGFIGMQVAAFLYVMKKPVPKGKILDLAALSGVLALCIGRWGCFFAVRSGSKRNSLGGGIC